MFVVQDAYAYPSARTDRPGEKAEEVPVLMIVAVAHVFEPAGRIRAYTVLLNSR